MVAKVSFIWRMLFLWMFGIACGIFITVATITTKVNKGQIINIGKIKIKNADDTTFRIYPHTDEQAKPPQEKTKRELRKERREDGKP